MARFTCYAGHESPEHRRVVLFPGTSALPVCEVVVAGETCSSPTRECMWCEHLATARADNETGRLYACGYHADLCLSVIADNLPPCEDCGGQVDTPDQWRCERCAPARPKTGAAL